jgi:hypothetical protein
MARVILGNNETHTVFDNRQASDVFGSNGAADVVRIRGNTTAAVNVQSSVERVELAGKIDQFKFSGSGNELTVLRNGVVEAKIYANADGGGTRVAFADGSALLTVSSAGLKIGAAAVPAVAGAITAADAGLNVSDSPPWFDPITGPIQTFTLTSGAVTSVNEGSEVTFTLATTNVAAGTVYNYLLGGTNITSADIVGGELTKSITIGNDGVAYVIAKIANDLALEGAETLTLTLAGKTASVTINDTSVPPVNVLTTLTTGIDTIAGTAGDDVFTAPAGTWAVGDVVTGGAGNDTFSATITGTGPQQSATSLATVETLNLTASPNSATLDLANVAGLTSVNNSNSANGATLGVTNVGNVVNTTITGGNSSTTIGYTTAATVGLTDQANLSLNGVGAGSSFVTSGVETLNVAVNSASTLSTLTDTGITRLNISGAGALTIVNAVGGTTLTTVNASGLTGALTLNLGDGPGTAVLATGVKFTGGSGATILNTGALNDTVDGGAGTNTINTGGGNDTITTGLGGTTTVTPDGGNDTITLQGTDTVRFEGAGTATSDIISGYAAGDVFSFWLGSAATATTNATVSTSPFGTVQTGGTSPVWSNVNGLGTAATIVHQPIISGATATVGTVPGTANVLNLQGVFTDGTATGVVSALGTTATTGITTTATGKFVLATYSVGNIAQLWAYSGDTTSNSDIDATELSLIAALTGVTPNSLPATAFSTYLTPATATTTVPNGGSTFTLTGLSNQVLTTLNAAGQIMTGGNETITVQVGSLPLGVQTATAGLTVLDPSTTDADVLSATVLGADWNSGTVISNVETVNLTMLASDTNGFNATTTLPNHKNINFSGAGNVAGISGAVSGTTAIGFASGYTGTVTLDQGATIAALTLNLNGGTTGTTAATNPTLVLATNATTALLPAVATTVTNLTVNVNANSLLSTDTRASVLGSSAATGGVALRGSGNLTIFDSATNFDGAAITATSPNYTGALTLRPNSAGNMNFVTTGSVVTGVSAIDYSDLTTASATSGNTVTLSGASSGGNSITIIDNPLASAARGSAIGGVGGFTLVQAGSSLADQATFNFGASTTPSIGALTATSTETVSINYTPTTAGTAFTATSIDLGANIGTQTVNVSGTGAFSLGTVTADALSSTGVGSTGSVIARLANGTSGVSFTAGAGAANVIGSVNGDIFTGGAGADTFRNTASGAAVTSNDRMIGGAGNDTFVLSGSASATVAAGSPLTVYNTAPNIADFSLSGANGVDVLSLSATSTNYGAGITYYTGILSGTVQAASATTTVIVDLARNGSSNISTAANASGDLVRLINPIAAATSVQGTFNDAIGMTGSIIGFAAGDSIFVSMFDSTNLKMDVLLANVGTDAILNSGDVVTLVGTIDMTAAQYAGFTNANLAFVAS